jgi:hypothetical protein
MPNALIEPVRHATSLPELMIGIESMADDGEQGMITGNSG